MKAFDNLVAVVERLRKECPWDREQTLESLRTYLIEETYEVLAAIDDFRKSPTEGLPALIEEWGDLLLQIILESIIVKETHPTATLENICAGLSEKLIRRHPHVFGENKLHDSQTVLKQWDQIKAKEKKVDSPSLLSGIQPKAPALVHSLKIGERSKKIKFDWNHSSEVWKQVLSEIQELESEKTDFRRKEEELGDVLFSLVQWARHEKINPEVALAGANEKFFKRFSEMEYLIKDRKMEWDSLSMNEKESLWQEAKDRLKNR